MNTHRRSLLLGLATLALAGCAAKPALTHIQDHNADFHAYRTFAFYPAPAQGHSLIERRLLAAAREQLERRGYAFDELAPDLLLNIAAIVEDRQGLRNAPGAVPGTAGLETEDYRLGRLGIDLIDVRHRQVVWHGVAEGRVSDAMLRDAGAAADKAVAEIFKAFPIDPHPRAAAARATTLR